MKFISLGTINIKFLIPVVGGIINLIHNYFIRYSPKIEIINQNHFLETIYATIKMFFAFIPFLIIKYKTKADNKIYNEQLIKSEYYRKIKDRKNAIKKAKFKKYRFILYSTLIVFLESLLATFFTQYFVYNLWIFEITFMSIFSYLILKTKYYKHQFIR